MDFYLTGAMYKRNIRKPEDYDYYQYGKKCLMYVKQNIRKLTKIKQLSKLSRITRRKTKNRLNKPRNFHAFIDNSAITQQIRRTKMRYEIGIPGDCSKSLPLFLRTCQETEMPWLVTVEGDNDDTQGAIKLFL